MTKAKTKARNISTSIKSPKWINRNRVNGNLSRPIKNVACYYCANYTRTIPGNNYLFYIISTFLSHIGGLETRLKIKETN